MIWGANVAWTTALFRPDLINGIAALSNPYRARIPQPPLERYRDTLGPRFYQLYYQTPGVAEREFEADVRRTIRTLLCGVSGQVARVYDLLVGDNGMELTRLGGHLNTMGDKPNLEDVHHAPEVHQAVPARVSG